MEARVSGDLAVGSVYPAPEYPYDILPYILFAYLIAGAAWFARLKVPMEYSSRAAAVMLARTQANTLNIAVAALIPEGSCVPLRRITHS